MRANQSVLLEVYSSDPTCTICSKMSKIIREFADRMRNRKKDILVARFDVATNGFPVPGFDVADVPALWFLMEGAVVPEVVDVRSVDGLAELVEHKQLGTRSPSVLKVTNATFVDVVFESNRNVLLEVYAPWCPHCQSLEPQYEELAQEVEDQGLDVVVAKMDGTKHNIPWQGFDIPGYPTIFYVPAGATTPEVVPGRSAAALLGWLQAKGVAKRGS
mmetsp:Transcript_90174/g.206201  ORF Transcript_90174/g.206201 Transcript_90174/m.206201 type:complete len:217 (+) Transcript_90174:1595-2245(+)